MAKLKVTKETKYVPFFTFLEDKLGRTQKAAKAKLDEYLGDYKATDYDCITVVFAVGNNWYVRTALNSVSSYNKLKIEDSSLVNLKKLSFYNSLRVYDLLIPPHRGGVGGRF